LKGRDIFFLLNKPDNFRNSLFSGPFDFRASLQKPENGQAQGYGSKKC